MAVPTAIKHYFVHQIFSKNENSAEKVKFRKKSSLRVCSGGKC